MEDTQTDLETMGCMVVNTEIWVYGGQANITTCKAAQSTSLKPGAEKLLVPSLLMWNSIITQHSLVSDKSTDGFFNIPWQKWQHKWNDSSGKQIPYFPEHKTHLHS